MFVLCDYNSIQATDEDQCTWRIDNDFRLKPVVLYRLILVFIHKGKYKIIIYYFKFGLLQKWLFVDSKWFTLCFYRKCHCKKGLDRRNSSDDNYLQEFQDLDRGLKEDLRTWGLHEDFTIISNWNRLSYRN